MVADEKKNDDAPFTIENNVLKGKLVPCIPRYTSVGQLLFDTMKNNPNIVGQVDVATEQEDTLAEMLERAIKCALWLQKQGVMKGDMVAVSTHNHFDSFIPCIASLFIGAVFNPWDYEMNIQLARYFMNLTEPKVIFANEQSVGVVLEAAKIETFPIKVVCFGDYPGAIPFSEVLNSHDNSAVENFQCTEIDDHLHPATVFFSSGTTGLPKGVQLPHLSWLHILEGKDVLSFNNLTPLWFSSLYWISGTLLSMKSLGACTKKIIGGDYDEKTACEIIEKYKVTWLMLGTSMANRFARYTDLKNYDLSSLKYMLIGGASMKQESEKVLRKSVPNTSIVQAYGMTELGGICTVQLPDSTNGSCGVVLANCEIKIIDPETQKTLGPNQTGELCAKTPTMMTGYYKNPEATKSIIDKEGWIHSGDLAYYNEKGEIFIIDRLKEMIKYRGHQITPTEIESLLHTHPAVLEVAVIGVPHPTDDEHPVAFISKVPNKEVKAQEIINLVETNLMDHCKLRGGVHFMASLPHTPSGKIARKELKAIAKTLRVS
ncbi:luciferin 4-monooxygenase [Calliopsis andreniformis]|uniref:luciferin 4-monooxygenase n=1 Tax=Calliopsis andreniformis TaxID=337506 RepID=UPI003FCE17E1